MSRNSGPFPALFEGGPRVAPSYDAGVNCTPLPFVRPLRHVRLAAAAGLCAVAGLLSAPAAAQVQLADAPTLAEPLATQVRQLLLDRVIGPATPRAEVTLGRLDPRLRLAACQKVDAYLPTGARVWGPTRVGLRCVDGPTAWNVYLPVNVQVFGPGLVAAAPLPAGHVLTQADLRSAEINLTDSRSPAVLDGATVLGRVLSQALTAGETLRVTGMKSRQWFAPGDTVQLRAVGGGFAIAASGEALTAGLEGQSVRVRTTGGKVVVGQAVGDKMVEITL